MKPFLLSSVAVCLCMASSSPAAVVHRAYIDPDYPEVSDPFISSSCDFNGDGTIDLTLRPLHYEALSTVGVWADATAGVIRNTSLSIEPVRYLAVAALVVGAQVGNQAPSGTDWMLGNVSIIESTTHQIDVVATADVAWKGGSPYFGIAFQASDGFHFGWVKLTGVSVFGTRVDSWAYESEPGKVILVGAVPEPGVVFLLAAGAAWGGGRRRRCAR